MTLTDSAISESFLQILQLGEIRFFYREVGMSKVVETTKNALKLGK